MLVERGAGDVDLDHQVRRRVDFEVYPVLTAGAFLVLNVEAGIGFEAALQFLAPKVVEPRSRTSMSNSSANTSTSRARPRLIESCSGDGLKISNSPRS